MTIMASDAHHNRATSVALQAHDDGTTLLQSTKYFPKTPYQLQVPHYIAHRRSHLGMLLRRLEAKKKARIARTGRERGERETRQRRRRGEGKSDEGANEGKVQSYPCSQSRGAISGALRIHHQLCRRGRVPSPSECALLGGGPLPSLYQEEAARPVLLPSVLAQMEEIKVKHRDYY